MRINNGPGECSTPCAQPLTKVLAYPSAEIEGPINRASPKDLSKGVGSYVVDGFGNMLGL